MRELDKEMIKELKYIADSNINVTLNYANEIIKDYSTWENVEIIEGCLLDNYLVYLDNDKIYGIGFIEKCVNEWTSQYKIEIYKSVHDFDNAYSRMYN